MYCKNCSKEINEKAEVCTACGVRKGKGSNYCHECGSKCNEYAEICTVCGVKLNTDMMKNNLRVNENGKSKLIAVLLCIFLGTLGIHRFYVGDNTKGFILLGLTLSGVLTCGITTLISAIWEVVDLILIILDKITDKNGVPLEW